MKKLLLLLFFYSSLSFALDFAELVNTAKSKINSLFGTQEASMKTQSLVMPPIPIVKGNATDVGVYVKKGQIYKQGNSFNKLSLEDKRKYRIAFIKELYEVVRNSQPKKTEILTSLNVLEQDGTREGIYRSLVLDQVYSSLEGYDDEPSEELVKFSLKYGKDFLGRDFSESAIKKINLWSIKRVLVEKTLEVMDAFPKDGKDLHIWYALVSADLSQQNQSLWKSKLRKKTQSMDHYSWVRKVPFQQIKSEMIIKLHKVMNSIN